MYEQISQYLDFSGPNLNVQVALCALAIWLAMIGCGVSSVLSKGFSTERKRFFLILICAVPVLGLLYYLPFSLQKESVPFVPFWKRQFRKG